MHENQCKYHDRNQNLMTVNKLLTKRICRGVTTEHIQNSKNFCKTFIEKWKNSPHVDSWPVGETDSGSEQLQETPVQELEDYERESEWETWPCE
jgi:hypothetical protein